MGKRFHSASTLNETQVVTFGGCHSDYIFLNEMNVFEMKDFLEDPINSNYVVCTTVSNSKGDIPSRRWGHTANVFKNEIYIFGGRNESDVNDLYKYNIEMNEWNQIHFQGVLPIARRRHSSVFVSSAFVVFGGFDGSFYNDMHVVDFHGYKRR